MSINLSIINSLNNSNITIEQFKCPPTCNIPDFSFMLILIFICLSISYFRINEMVSERLNISEEEKKRWYFRFLKHDFWVGNAWTISFFYLLLQLFYGG